MGKKAPRVHVPSKDGAPAPLVKQQERAPQSVVLDNAFVVPGIHRLLTDSQAILSNELTNLLNASKRGALSYKQSQMLHRYVMSTAALAREERAQARAEDLEKLNDEQLLAVLLENPDFKRKLMLMLAGGDEDGMD